MRYIGVRGVETTVIECGLNRVTTVELQEVVVLAKETMSLPIGFETVEGQRQTHI